MTNINSTHKRPLQLAEDIRVFIANMFAKDQIRDPRVRGLTIHYVKLTDDLRIARVYYIAPLTAKRVELNKILKKIASYIRRALGQRLLIRYIPEIHFYYDDNQEHALKVNELLAKIDKNE